VSEPTNSKGLTKIIAVVRKAIEKSLPVLRRLGLLLMQLSKKTAEYARIIVTYYRWLLRPAASHLEGTVVASPVAQGEELKRIFFQGNWRSERKTLPKFQVLGAATDAPVIHQAVLQEIRSRHPGTEIGWAWETDVKEGASQTFRFVDRMERGFVAVADLRMFMRGQDLMISFTSQAWSKLRFFGRVVGSALVAVLFLIALWAISATDGFRKSWVRDFAKKHADTSSVSTSFSTGYSSPGGYSRGSSTSYTYTHVEELESFIETGRDLNGDERLDIVRAVLNRHPELATTYGDNIARMSSFMRQAAQKKWEAWRNKRGRELELASTAPKEKTVWAEIDRDVLQFGYVQQIGGFRMGGETLSLTVIKQRLNELQAMPSFKDKVYMAAWLWTALCVDAERIDNFQASVKEYWRQMRLVMSGLNDEDPEELTSWEQLVRRALPKPVLAEIDAELAAARPKRWSNFELFWRDWSLFLLGPAKILALIFGALWVLVLWVPKSALRMLCELFKWPAPQTFDEFVDSQAGEMQGIVSRALLEIGVTEDRILRLM